jgi:hypothetical protein
MPPMSRTEKLDPVYAKLDTALRAIGYSFESAVADIIDNSIDAKADRIRIRLLIGGDKRLGLMIADNGSGMTDVKLREAMRFGTDMDEEIQRLGKFGCGLKLASLSQARALLVFSKVEGHEFNGRAWLEGGIRKGFECTIYDKKESVSLIKKMLPDKEFGPKGTIVYWECLYRVGNRGPDVNAFAQKLLRRLQGHLSLSFHRFLTGAAQPLHIELDIFDEVASSAGLPIRVWALNPFGYEVTGHSDFPQDLELTGKYNSKVKIRLHIWPANSNSPEYKLPGGANSRQGLYFYRKDRLIHGGGWKDLQRETDSHCSLARVEVDLDPEVDVEVSLNVDKSEIHLPEDLIHIIEQAKTKSGISFKQYLGLANKAYRKRQFTAKELPLVPGEGFPSVLQEFLYYELKLDETTKCRKVGFKWAELDDDSFFWINPDEDTIYLNRDYRNQLLHGLKGSSTDIPVVKCLLFFLAADALYADRLGPKVRERIDLINLVLKRAVKYERTAP